MYLVKILCTKITWVCFPTLMLPSLFRVIMLLLLLIWKTVSFIHFDYAKAFGWVNHNKLWKILKEKGIPDHLTCLLRNLNAGKKQQLEPDMEQQTGSKLGKEYVKAVYCHPAYLTYMLSISWEMSSKMKRKLESGLPGEVSIASDMQMTPPLWQKVKKN